jgi:hypothetical protein
MSDIVNPGAGFVRHRFALAAAVAVPLAAGMCMTTSAHADAGGWTQQSVPGGAGNILAVTSVSPGTLWATGFSSSDTGGGVSFAPLVLSRTAGGDGAWSAVPTPAISGSSRANAISAAGPDDVWISGYATLLGATLTAQGLDVVGYDPSGTTMIPYGEVLEGGAWQSLNLPDVGSGAEYNAVASTRDGLVAVGSSSVPNDLSDSFPLAEQNQQ